MSEPIPDRDGQPSAALRDRVARLLDELIEAAGANRLIHPRVSRAVGERRDAVLAALSRASGEGGRSPEPKLDSASVSSNPPRDAEPVAPLRERHETLLCLKCSTWSPYAKWDSHKGCPACGETQGVPAWDTDIVTVKITWHELRCLVMWAENWAYQHRRDDDLMQRVVYGIADRLTSQHLDKIALTMAGETADIKARFGEHNVETHNIPEPPEDPR